MTRLLIRRTGLVALTCAAIVALSACAPAADPDDEGSGATSPTAAPTTPPPLPEFIADGGAEENLPFFQHLLDEYAQSDGDVLGQPIVDAVTSGGFLREDMQVSFDRSKTNLAADSIYVSVLMGESCLLGQMVTADRSVHAVVEPAVGPEKNICLIGETRPIDW